MQLVNACVGASVPTMAVVATVPVAPIAPVVPIAPVSSVAPMTPPPPVSTGLHDLESIISSPIRVSNPRGTPAQQRMLRLLQRLRSEAVARQFAANAEIQHIDDMILTLQSEVEASGDNMTVNDVHMAGSLPGDRM